MLISPDSAGLTTAVQAIKDGHLVAYPTDTFFALGADGLNSDAVEKVFLAKGRNPGTPVPLLISDLAMLENLTGELSDNMAKLVEVFWPGALTIVVPANDDIPDAVTGGTKTVGLRIPDHDLARELIATAATPLTGTSCNVTGQPPMKAAVGVERSLGSRIHACVDAACGINTAPSTVIRFGDNRINVLRLGAISVESIRNVVGELDVG